MEYIQCQHCEKKYAVNDKLKAAVGKKIRCKHCQETFEIVLQQDISNKKGKQQTAENSLAKASVSSEKSEQANALEIPATENSDRHVESPSDKKPEKKATAGKKRLNVQLIISIVLACILIIGGTVAFLYFNNPDLFRPDVKKEISKTMQPAIPDFNPFAKPIGPAIQQPESATGETVGKTDLKADNKPDESAPDNGESVAPPSTEIDDIEADKTTTDAEVQTPPSKPDDVLAGPKNPSQDCRDAAAAHWMRTHKLSHVRMSTEQYMKLFNLGVEQTAQVRKLCKDKSQIVKLTTAAREEKIPEWIRKEIETRTDLEEARKKQLESTNR